MIAQAGKDHRGAHGCLPTARQQLLVRAAAAPVAVARQAWQTWREGTDLAAVDSASGRLLLWIYHRREELELSAADAAALEPRYRQTWLRNQVLLNRCAEVVGHLQASGIECLLLKGMALLTDVYADEGGRYLEDFDLLVGPEQVPRAVAALNTLGWHALHPEELSLEARHAHGFYNAEGLSCDLHWHLLWRAHAAVNEAPLWATKRPLRVRDEPTFTLAAEHLLLHLCVHGMAWETVPPIRWLLDVHLLLQRHPVQWELVLAEARRRGVTLPLAEALSVYETSLPGELPTFLHEQLRLLPASEEQRLAYAQLVTEPTLRAVLRGLMTDWKAAQRRGEVPVGCRSAVRFLCLRWRVPSAWALPGQFVRRFRRRWRSVNFLR